MRRLIKKLFLKVETAVLGLIVATIALAAFPAVAQDELVIGVFPRRDPAVTFQLFKPLRTYLEDTLGVPVTLQTAKDFETFEHNVEMRRYDLVHFNQYHYLIAHDASQYDVLVQNEEFGEQRISGAIYVRKDSGITDLQQLRGKDIIFGGGAKAMMSYIVPTYLLRQAGLNEGDYTEHFSSSPPNAVLATFMHQAAACGAGEVVRRLPIVKNKIDVDQLTLLAVSAPLPHLPWAVKHEMSQDFQTRLQDALLQLNTTPEGREILKSAQLTGFNPATDEDYDQHRAIVRAVQGGVGLTN